MPTPTTTTLYGHPWSINTRKVLMLLAEKGHEAKLHLVMVPKGEHKAAPHLARHPFGKVPVLEHEGLMLYETRAITRYLDDVLAGPKLTPAGGAERARVEQWMGVADSYFVPHAHPLLVETLFRQYIGGQRDDALVDAARPGMEPALSTADAWLAERPYLAGGTFSLADIHWMPYVEYLVQTGQGAPVTDRPHLAAWWDRVSSRPAWQKIARTGPQPYDRGMTADVVEQQYR